MVNYYPIYGVGINTEAIFEYPQKCSEGKDFDCQPTIKFKNGDGTIVYESLSYGK